MEVNF